MNWGQDRGAEVVEKRGRPRSGGVEVCVHALVISAPVFWGSAVVMVVRCSCCVLKRACRLSVM